MPFRFLPLLTSVIFALACSDRDRAPVVGAPSEPVGPVPSVEAVPGFGDGPVEGVLTLRPAEDGPGWTYRVDLDQDGVFEREGDLADAIDLPYRFVEPGVHELLVILRGPGGAREEVRVPIVVNDPTAVRVVRETVVGHADPDEPGGFEGITAGPDGRFVYLSEFRGDAIHRLDGSSLEVVDVLGDLGRVGIEGLSVTPSGRFLVANFKNGFAFLVVELDGMEVHRFFEPVGPGAGFYVDPLDHRLALIGKAALTVLDYVTGEVVRQYAPPDGDGIFEAWHFDVSPDGRFAAVAATRGKTIDIVRLPELEREATLEVPGPEGTSLVSFDATGRTLYLLLVRSVELPRFVALDVETGRVLTDLVLDSADCFAYCVATPTARSRDGRYVAFETMEGVLFVDTRTHLPMYRSPPHGPVAASPVENVFYTVSLSGRVRVLEVAP